MAEPSSFHHPHGRSSSVLDLQLNWTTTLALIGQDAIYVATDERCSDKPSPYMIMTENSPKTFVISNNVLATISGDPHICRSMLTYAKLEVEHDIAVGRYVSNEAVVAAATHALQYVATWEGQNPNIRFPSRTLIAGWANGAPSVCEIPSRQRLPEPKHVRGDGFAIGSGEQYVYDYYNLDDPFPSRRGLPPRSDEELAQLAKRAVVYSALNDRFTGGRARLVKVRRDGIIESDPEEILQVLHDDYDNFKMYLSCVILCLYRKSDYEYASDNENLLSDAISVRFTPIQGSYLIGIQEKYYIRILRFEDVSTAKKEFEGVKLQWKQLGYAHTQDVEVNVVIRGLPWIELPQLPHIPLVFSMATKKMINLFLDL